MKSDKSKSISVSEARQKIYRYCAYQERSHSEVKNKLYEFGLRSFEVDEVLTHLITEGFLNEERFAKAFAGGKFRIKKWGRMKITRELEAKGLTKNCIKLGLKEIDNESYEATLKSILKKKIVSLSSEKNRFIKRKKVAQFTISKGFEPEMVWSELKKMLPE